MLAGGKGVILRSAGGGASWSRVYSGGGLVTFLHVAGKTGEALISGNLWSTSDAGIHWSKVHTALSGPLKQVSFGSGGFGLGIGAGTLMATDDGGRTWHAVSGLHAATVQALMAAGSAQGWVVAGGVQNGTSWARPVVMETTDHGKSWHTLYRLPVNAPGAVGGWTYTLAFDGSDVWLLLNGEGGATSHRPYAVFAGGVAGTWKEIADGPWPGAYPDVKAAAQGTKVGAIGAGGGHAWLLRWLPGGVTAGGKKADALTVTEMSPSGSLAGQIIATESSACVPSFYAPSSIAVQGGRIWIVGSRKGAGRIMTGSGSGWSYLGAKGPCA